MKIVRAKDLEGPCGGVGGMDAWDSNMVLHMRQDGLWLAMSAAMPGQNTDASAFDCIMVVPW